MKTVLAYLQGRGQFFIDSVTTGGSVVRAAAARVGTTTYSRDVFLDAAFGDKSAIRKQIKLAEQIAIETGYVVAIAHPHPETLDVVGAWLTTAEARGFDLASVLMLEEIRTKENKRAVARLAPDLRY